MMKPSILIPCLTLLSSTSALACGSVTVEGMTCDGCAKSVRKALKENPAVADAQVDHKSGLVKIECKKDQKISSEDIQKAIEAAGFKIKS